MPLDGRTEGRAARRAPDLSRRDIDPDALKVLYRLRQFNHTAYLVGGSVRDLLIGRRPKDFDIGTSAHPYQVKKLFRNCWIIGRRFRLAHVKFGRRSSRSPRSDDRSRPGEEIVQDGVPAPDPTTPEAEHLIHRDNTFGTPEEDAFRRDFTINALSTTSRRFRSSTTSADWRICAPASCDRSAIPRSGSAKIRCG